VELAELGLHENECQANEAVLRGCCTRGLNNSLCIPYGTLAQIIAAERDSDNGASLCCCNVSRLGTTVRVDRGASGDRKASSEHL
jgi:hypothetical protein